MRVVIAKVDETLFDDEAQSLSVPGQGGEMTILSHHMPLITVLKRGVVVVRAGSLVEPLCIPIESGVLEVRPEGTTVIL